ncbi:MAG: efflux RND transporter periplasmic adaptor subunit [Burkholderiaceae bacterium]|nr:efflux RND transporter periplasmic adaptor subunit [Burkholderiaceae bacterium]
MKPTSLLRHVTSRTEIAPPLLCIAVISALLSGCSDQRPSTDQFTRAVKVEKIGSESASTWRFYGVARQLERSDLSFESRGRIAKIDAEVGDSVQRGQELAALDLAPAKLRSAQAEANLLAAKAQLAERKLQLDRQQALYTDGTASATALETARVGYQAAASQLQVSQSNLELAQREVRNSVIVAPFDGRIVNRAAQRFSDVAEGQVIVQIEGDGQQEIVVMLPGTLADQLHPGMRAFAHADEKSAKPASVILKEISSRAEGGSLVQAIFRVEGKNAWLHSGMAVDVRIPNPAAAGFPAVRPEALLMELAGHQARVFIYDDKRQSVNLREITLGETVDGRVQVKKGLVSGELVVVAGPQFLVDGESVSLFRPATQISQEM